MSDLISRKALLKMLDSQPIMTTLKRNGYEMATAYDFYHSIRPMIEHMASAEPKKGKWIDEGWYADGLDHHAYYCSKCREHHIKRPDEIIKFKYCPNCGAKMEESEDE